MKLVRAGAATILCLAALWGAAHIGLLPSALGLRPERLSAGPAALMPPARIHWRMPILR
ncbi:MAG: hypothetical protein VX205_15090 [Pseudomonadota bacterium]|nr:hypothetical protein [Sphingobium naphthae]MEC7934027.1 hypothetical protein [Pseudomonadota bacterium]MEC8036310.1 hypothetical protein [Pseudomonadota bacterium]